MKKFFLLCLTPIFLGCASMGGAMSPEQMAVNVKDKNAVVACGAGTGPWGKVMTVYVDTNKINDNNSVTVDDSCKVSVTGTKSVPAKP